MQGQYLRYTNTAPVIRLFAWSTADGLPVTSLTFSNTGLTTTRGLTDTVHTLVTATLGTWVSNGFIHRGAGIYDWYAPVSVNATGEDVIEVRASTLPAGVAISPFTVALGADDLTAAAESSATLATAVWASGARTLTSGAAPSAVDVASAVRTNLTTELARIDAPVSAALTPAGLTGPITALRQALSVGAKFGGPAIGGTSSVLPVYDAGNSAVLLGTVIVYRDVTGAVVGQTELTPP